MSDLEYMEREELVREIAALAQRVEELKAERVRMRDATNKELASLRESWDAAERKLREMREARLKACAFITNVCQILDVVKIEWAEAWSDWEQSVRDAATTWLKQYYAEAEAERALGDAQQKGGV